MYIDNSIFNDSYFRDSETKSEYEVTDNPYDIYELETYDIPEGCPYRSLVPPPFPPVGNNPQGNSNVPKNPPPTFVPQKENVAKAGPNMKAVDSGALRPCLYRNVYIWPKFGRGFWAWLTFVGRRSVSGYRWNGYRWIYFGLALNTIEGFYCS